MKKLIAAAFTLLLLGAGIAQALTFNIHTNPRHRHCSGQRPHQVCRWV